jgi:hypothetical protein
MPYILYGPDASEKIHDHAVPQKLADQRNNEKAEYEGDYQSGELNVRVLLLRRIIRIHKPL